MSEHFHFKILKLIFILENKGIFNFKLQKDCNFLFNFFPLKMYNVVLLSTYNIGWARCIHEMHGSDVTIIFPKCLAFKYLVDANIYE